MYVLRLRDLGVELQLRSDDHLLARKQLFVRVFKGQFDLLESRVGDCGIVDKCPAEVVVVGHGVLLWRVPLESLSEIISCKFNLIPLRPFHELTCGICSAAYLIQSLFARVPCDAVSPRSAVRQLFFVSKSH